MKKSTTALIISIIFLACSILFVIVKNATGKSITTTNDMTIKYVSANFDIDLFDEFNENNIELTAKANYIGNDKIVNEPKIVLDIKCSYVYEDANELFDDLLEDEMILTKDDTTYNGKLSFEIKRDNIDSISCYYKIKDVFGNYSKTR